MKLIRFGMSSRVAASACVIYIGIVITGITASFCARWISELTFLMVLISARDDTRLSLSLSPLD